MISILIFKTNQKSITNSNNNKVAFILVVAVVTYGFYFVKLKTNSVTKVQHVISHFLFSCIIGLLFLFLGDFLLFWALALPSFPIPLPPSLLSRALPLAHFLSGKPTYTTSHIFRCTFRMRICTTDYNYFWYIFVHIYFTFLFGHVKTTRTKKKYIIQ